MSLIRLALPNINNYQDDIEQWITTSMGFPVEINELSATWRSWTPYIYLHNINIFDQSGTSTIADFKSAHVTIDIISSLKKMEFVPANINVSGLDLTLVFNQDGSINITEKQEDQISAGNTGSAMAYWLLNQKEITITDSTINVVNQHVSSTNSLQLNDVTLSLISNAYRTQIDGDAKLPGWLGEKISFALDARGDLLTSTWSGDFYIEGKNILPFAWLANNNDKYSHLSSSPGQIKIWSEWKNAKTRNISGEIIVNNLNFQTNNDYYIKKLVSDFSFNRRTDKGIDIQIDIKKLDSTFGAWPASKIEYSKFQDQENNNYIYRVIADYIKIEDYINITQSFPKIFGNVKLASDIALEGELINTDLSYNPSLPLFERFWINTELNSLGYKDFKSNSHISGLSGILGGNIYQGNLNINTNVLDINYPAQWDYPHYFYEITGDINWIKESDAWVLNTQILDGHTPKFDTRLKGIIKIPHNTSDVYADLIVSLSEVDLEEIGKNLPKAINQEARSWILNSLVSGKVSSTDIILRGKLSDYPFLNQEGQFKAISQINNATLDYHPDWIPVDGIDAEVVFDGTGLKINANSGKIYNANITKATALIADLFADDPIVKIQGEIDGNTKDAKVLISHSPLLNNLFLKEIINNEIDGLLSLELELEIPLESEDVGVNGVLNLHNVTHESEDTGIKLGNINGTINFTQDTIFSSGLIADYFGRKVSLNINKENESFPDIILEGKADKNFIIEQISYFYPTITNSTEWLKDKIEGSCNWTAKYDFKSNSSNDIFEMITINSDLNGLSLELPPPLGKDLLTRSFTLSSMVDDSAIKEIDIEYGDILKSKLIIDKTTSIPFIKLAQIDFGTEHDYTRHQHGVHVNGFINNLDISDWLELFNNTEFKPHANQVDDISFSLNTSSLHFIQQTFHDATLKLYNDNNWKILFTSNESSGEIHIPKNNNSAPIKVVLDQLRLDNISAEAGHEYDVNNLPALDIHISDLNFSDINLGEFVANTTRIENGINIDNFTFKKPDFLIAGEGYWVNENNIDQSNFNILIQATKLAYMLETFNYNVASIEEASTNIKIDANWTGSPMDFSYESLNGNVVMEIENGEFLDFDPSAGRLFGLLSIQTLPRRLSLDFSDLFSKGLAFDHIEGKFNIESGNAYTNNLVLTGPVADISVSGRTGLVHKDYDQIVTVIPQVADSLPVASALFGPIGIGVGAVIFLAGELFESIPEQIDKLLRYQYTVTGSWDDPVVERYNKTQIEEKNPLSGQG